MPKLPAQMILIFPAVSSKSILVVVLLGMIAACPNSFAQDSTAKRFGYDVISFATASGTDSVRTDIYLAVPYHFLFFQNAVDKYVADYSVKIEIRDSTGLTTLYSKEAE